MEIHRFDCVEMKTLCHKYKEGPAPRPARGTGPTWSGGGGGEGWGPGPAPPAREVKAILYSLIHDINNILPDSTS